MAEKLNFVLDSELDVYSEIDKGWLVATIIQTSITAIKIHYLQWGELHDTWI